jgi:hypothetical protein
VSISILAGHKISIGEEKTNHIHDRSKSGMLHATSKPLAGRKVSTLHIIWWRLLAFLFHSALQTGPEDALFGAVLRSTWNLTPWRVVELLMVWIAAGIADASIRGQVVPKVHANRDWPLIGLIEGPVGFHFLIAGV